MRKVVDVDGDTARFPGRDLLGSTPAEATLGWYLARVASRDSAGLVEEIRARFRPNELFEPAVLAGFMVERFEDLAGFRLVEVEVETPHVAIGTVETPAGVRWRACAATDPDTGLPRRVGSAQAPKPGVTVRAAEPSDGARLAQIVRRVPITYGEETLLLDYGEDYLAATAMAEDPVTLVAERDGEIIGLHGFAVTHLRWGDQAVECEYIRHTRIVPEAKGAGVFSALNGALFEVSLRHGDRPPFSLVVLRNDDMQKHLPDALRTWGTPWERFHLDTGAVANGAPPPVHEDLESAAALIAHAQGTPGLRVDATASWLADRLGRHPALYSPDRLRGSGGAVVGVGVQPIVVRRTGTESSSGSRHEAVAFDIGMAPRGERALDAVVRGWCARLAGEGIERLVLACGSASPVREVIAPLAVEHERYVLNFGLPIPGGTDASIAFDHALM